MITKNYSTKTNTINTVVNALGNVHGQIRGPDQLAKFINWLQQVKLNILMQKSKPKIRVFML